MTYKLQHRTFDFRSASIDENKITGAAAAIGNLDSYRTVICPGYFGADVLARFLARGFMADSHDWTKAIGMPLVAEERGRELYTEAEFHSDPASQAIRTKCLERKERGLAVGQSIGFQSAEEKSFPNGKALIDWARGQRYDMNLFDVVGISGYGSKCAALIRCAELFEYSQVMVPGNDQANAATVRSAAVEARGQYLGEDIEQQMCIEAVYRAMDRLCYRVFYPAICGSYEYDAELDEYTKNAPPLADALAMIEGGIEEFKGLALRVIEAILSGVPEAETPTVAALSLRALCGNPETKTFEDGALAARSFENELSSALAAVRSCKERSVAVQETRAANGRAISPARVAQLRDLTTELNAFVASVPSPYADRLRVLAMQSEANTNALFLSGLAA